MPKLIPLDGKVFSRWTVICRVKNKNQRGTFYKCKCECGTIRTVRNDGLLYGLSKCCGCITDGNIKHGRAVDGKNNTRTYKAWRNMISRCRWPNHKCWKWYGGRGIKVNYKNFDHFLSDAGEAPTESHTIDRIDNDKSYEPGNCRWVTMAEQRKNQFNGSRFKGPYGTSKEM